MPRVKAKAVSRSGQVRSAVCLTFCSTVLIFVVLPLALDIIVRRELSARRARSPYSRRGLVYSGPLIPLFLQLALGSSSYFLSTLLRPRVSFVDVVVDLC